MENILKNPSLGVLALFATIVTLPAAVTAEPSGEDIYFQTCALCHGDDGTGAMPDIPDVGGRDGPLWKSDTDVINTIMNGVERPDLPTPMPAKGGNEDLSIENVRRVLEFMRRKFGN